MADPGEVLELRASRTRWVVLLVVTVGFMGIGAFIYASAPGSRGGAGFMTLFAGACALLAVAQLVAPSRLVLTPQGFTTKSLGRRATRGWSDVESFVAIAGSGRTSGIVWIQLRPGGAARRAPMALAGLTSGDDGGYLPDSYGMTSSDLAKLLNEWRARFGGSAAQGD